MKEAAHKSKQYNSVYVTAQKQKEWSYIVRAVEMIISFLKNTKNAKIPQKTKDSLPQNL